MSEQKLENAAKALGIGMLIVGAFGLIIIISALIGIGAGVTSNVFHSVTGR